LKYLGFLLIGICISVSCDSDVGTGAVIVYGDVIGSYTGQCADYTISSSELTNREEATISVSAVNLTEASFSTSCARFTDQRLTLKSTSAAEITFEKVISATSVIFLKYVAESDSLILTQTGVDDKNLMFAGIRN